MNFRHAAMVFALASSIGCYNLTGRTVADAGDAVTDSADARQPSDAQGDLNALDATEADDLPDAFDTQQAVDVVLDASADIADAHDDADASAVDVSDVATDTCALTVCGEACVDTRSDVRHCGLCERDCTMLPSVVGASVRCEAGTCVIPTGACDAAHGDCDGDASNGCEADLTRSSNCGACGTVCSEPTPLCALMGTSRRCASGCDAASTRCGMSCANTANDPSNCGACGNACPVPSNGVAACASGRCGVLCDAGFHLCGGRCVDDALVTSCGARCEPCPLAAHATTTCSSGGCGFTCEANFADCDGDATNGCETDTRTSGANCGRCGNACTAPTGSVASCVAGRCEVMITCPSGQVLCGSSCQTVGATCLVGVGACARTGTTVCSAAGGGTTCSATPGVGTTEVCDGIDNDCDGLTDEGFCRIAGSCYSDGQANPVNACLRCVAPSTAAGSAVWSNAPAGFACRAAAGPCDVVEACDGTGAACPADSLMPMAVVCRASAGVCDVSEACTGASAACPPDLYVSATVVCRASAGLCDLPEVCTGSAARCPADALRLAGTVCRASTSVGGCDPSESCSGASATCPPDVVVRVPTTEACDGVDNNCNGLIDETPAASSCPTRANATNTCLAGVCGSACNAGFADCDGMATNGCEVDTRVSATNCGACMNACPAGAACVSGSCVTTADGCWYPMTTAGAPPGSVNVDPTWTGSQAIYWGGAIYGGVRNTGGLYDPMLDRWTTMSTMNAPSGRSVYGGVWTGSKFVVYGGYGYGAGAFLYDGGTYDPAADRWTAGVNISYRGAASPLAAWTGSRMFSWSGGNGVDTPSVGVLYDPTTNTSTPVSAMGAPPGRGQNWPAPWTGSQILVAGGPYVGGGMYNPTTNIWAPITSVGSPARRVSDFGVWTGSRFVIWGGQDPDLPTFFGDGAMYDPTSDRWTAMSTPGSPTVRGLHCMVWTGSRVLVWGGYNGAPLGDGAEFDPVRNVWSTLPASGAPSARWGHGCLWTGREMLVWGGRNTSVDFTSGARYVPGCFPAPRMIAPLSTATTTSQRPTLRWALSSLLDGAHVEVCADAGCRTVEQSFDVTGVSGRPPADLSVGVHFWRVFGRSAAGTGTASSPVWEFFVGRRSAPTDTSWGTTLDINGDGYVDLAVGAYGAMSNTGRVYVYPGSAAGLATTPSITLTGPDGSDGYFGSYVASAGDVNGDGYADLAVGANGVNRAYVYLGGASGLTLAPATTLTGPDGGGFGGVVGNAGDINRDGYADLFVGAGQAAGGAGRGYLYLGSVSGLATTPATTLIGPGSGNFGAMMVGTGDVSGDGYADVVVAAVNADRVFVYLGSASGLVATPATTIVGPDPGQFGGRLSVGDVNGDGYVDLVVGAKGAVSDTGRVYVYPGSMSGFATTPAATLTGPDGVGGFFGNVANAGDLNGDGYVDFVVGASSALSRTGHAYAYLGSASGLVTTPATTLTGPDGAGGFFGYQAKSAGDINGDGYADLAVGAYAALSSTGRTYVYLGSAMGLAGTPAITLTGPDGTGAQFSSSIACAGDVNGDRHASWALRGRAPVDLLGRHQLGRRRAPVAPAQRARSPSAPCEARRVRNFDRTHAAFPRDLRHAHALQQRLASAPPRERPRYLGIGA